MSPTAPATNPTSVNSNIPFGGFGQAQSDYGTASNILNFLPTQESQTTKNAANVNSNPGSILPNINVNSPVYNAPTPQTVNAGAFGSNLTGYNQAVQQAMQSLTSGENQTYGQALGQLSQAEQQYGNLTPIYQQLAQQYNIPGYQNDVATLSGLLQNLGRDVNAQTTLGGGLMTESARDEMYQNQAQPLQTALSNAGEFLNFGQQDVSNLLDAYQKSLANQLTPLETNISNLPTMFGQTNQAAQTGYEQGGTALENQIQNAQKQQEIAVEQGQLALQQKAYNAQYGASGAGGVLSALGSNNPGQTLPGVSGKPNAFAFNVNGKSASAGNWAINNASLWGQNTTPAQASLNMIYSMAASGDKAANQAYNEIENNNGNITPAIMNKYSSLFWGMPGFTGGAPSTPKTTSSTSSSSKSAPINNAIPGMNMLFGGVL